MFQCLIFFLKFSLDFITESRNTALSLSHWLRTVVFKSGSGTHLPDSTFWIEPDELDSAYLSLEQRGPLRHCWPSNSWAWLNRPQAAKGLPRKQDNAKAGWSFNSWSAMENSRNTCKTWPHVLPAFCNIRGSPLWKSSELRSSLPQQWRLAAAHPACCGTGQDWHLPGMPGREGSPQQSWQWVPLGRRGQKIWNWLQSVGPVLCCWNRGIRKALSVTLSLQGCYYSKPRTTSSWSDWHKLCLWQQNQKVWVLLEYMCCYQWNYETTEIHKIIPFVNITLINTLYAKIILSVGSVG